MIPKIKKILYATDLSENSRLASRYALNSAVQHNAELHILHVLEYRILSFTGDEKDGKNILYDGYFQKELEDYDLERRKQSRKYIQKRLEDFCKQELQGDSEPLKHIRSVILGEGYPAEQILRKAEELKADLLIIGTHGKGRLAHAFLGSVAESVLHRIKIPVWIIPLSGKQKKPRKIQ